ncbi:uncharacterized protein LOC131956059 [Physella acuta]|uniref:uncharacterized protein LOC131956059 n=1 Tax=Physella acuta TaxID=109671 RepID=UPI0027DE38AD|nr:uncharacterized protein LOC131956059 [Physella acuta]
MATVGNFLVFFMVGLPLVYCKGESTSGVYNCANGVYETMVKVTDDCRTGKYSPELKTFHKHEKRISGPVIANLLQGYCYVSQEVAGCAMDMVQSLPCLAAERDNYTLMVRRSDWMCDGLQLRDSVRQVFQHLPAQVMDYRSNTCYRSAPNKAYTCMRRYLEPARNPDRREKTRRTLNSFRCTYRKLAKECRPEAAFLFATLEYDWLIVPPALGFNISDVLLTAANIKF